MFFVFKPHLLLRSTPDGLIFFAAEDEGRTELPTERKKQREREKGRVPKSAEIPGSLVALGSLVILFFLGGWLLSRFFKLFKFFLADFNQLPEISLATLTPLFTHIAQEIGIILAPIIAVSVFMAIVANIAQVGFLFTLKPLKFDFSRIKLTPSNMMKRVFFSKQVGFTLLKTIIKVILLGWISYFIIYSDFISILETGSLNIGESLKILGFIAFKLALVLISVLFIMSIPDYIYQKKEFIENIKMTKQEIKEELKETEGDPMIKQRQKKRSMEMLRRNIMTTVKKADVVITNPIHFAIALRYDPQEENAPRMLAKGEDHLALVIKNIAKRESIPIIENKPLARELYYNVNENDIVPEQFYRILVDIFLGIEGIRERLQAKQAS